MDALNSLLLAERNRLPLWLPVGMAMGVLLFFLPRTEPGPWVACALLALSIPALVVGWHRLFGRILGSAMLVIALGFLAPYVSAHRQPPMPELPRRAVVLTGRITAIDTLPPRGLSAPADARAMLRRVTLAGTRFETTLDAGMPPLRRTLRIRLRDDDPLPLMPGQSIRLRAILQPPAFPAIPGGRDLQREAWFSGIGGSGRALDYVALATAQDAQLPEASSIAAIGAGGDTPGANAAPHGAPGSGFTISAAFKFLREVIASRITAVLPDARGAMAATLVTGLSSRISIEDRDAFAASGLSHLLAVAGLHLGIVMGLVMGFTRAAVSLWEWAALRVDSKRIAAGASLVAGAVYVLPTGTHLPALRSLAMAALVVLALVTGRRPASMRGLAVAALRLLLFMPAELLNVAFQMSFAAVMALIAGYDLLRPRLLALHGEGQLGRRLLVHGVMLALTSALAGSATLPVAMAHFGEVQPFFILANLLAVPVTALWVMPAGLVALLLMPLHLEALALVVMGQGIRLILFLARSIAHWPAARLAVPAMPSWGLLLFLLGLCWLCLWPRRWRLFGMGPMLIGLVSPFLVASPDFLVSADGGMMAVREAGQLLAGGHSRDATMNERDWAQAFAMKPGVLPMDGQPTGGAEEGGAAGGTEDEAAADMAVASASGMAEDRATSVPNGGKAAGMAAGGGAGAGGIAGAGRARPCTEQGVFQGAPETGSSVLRCDLGVPGVCVFTHNGHRVLLRVIDKSDGDATLPAALCQGVDLFVSASPARRSCAEVPFIDRFTVWEQGAQAIYVRRAGIAVVSDRQWRGARLWVMRAGGHGVPNLPLAQAE